MATPVFRGIIAKTLLCEAQKLKWSTPLERSDDLLQLILPRMAAVPLALKPSAIKRRTDVPPLEGESKSSSFFVARRQIVLPLALKVQAIPFLELANPIAKLLNLTPI